MVVVVVVVVAAGALLFVGAVFGGGMVVVVVVVGEVARPKAHTHAYTRLHTLTHSHTHTHTLTIMCMCVYCVCYHGTRPNNLLTPLNNIITQCYHGTRLGHTRVENTIPFNRQEMIGEGEGKEEGNCSSTPAVVVTMSDEYSRTPQVHG